MPRTGVYTSPQERQNIRQSYYATSGKEAGVAHLWHMQQLADIRFSPNHTIQDVPEVDFRSSGGPADDYRSLFAQRFAQQVQHDEARIHEENKNIYRSLVLASDDAARQARNMNLVPTENQVSRFDNIQQQTLHRTQDRERRQRAVAEENRRLLDHLVRVPPHVRPAKELDAWYHDVHKKRVAQLSRFKPAEPYAGAALLESSRSRGGAERRRTEEAAAAPLVRGQPYPFSSTVEAARAAPSSLQPAATFSSADGTGLDSSRRQRKPDWQPLAATDIPLLHYTADQQLRASQQNHPCRYSSGNDSDRQPQQQQQRWGGESPPPPQPVRSPSPAQRELFPAAPGASPAAANARGATLPTQSANATAMSSSSGGGGRRGRRVTAQEEGGVTQLWRRAVEVRHGSATPQQHTMTVSKGERATAAAAPRSPSMQQQQIPPPTRPMQSPPSFSSGMSNNNGVGCGRQRRLSDSAPMLASTRPPLAAAVQAAASPPASVVDRRSPEVVFSEAYDDDDDGDTAAAAALRELMAGWTRRGEASGAAYLPM